MSYSCNVTLLDEVLDRSGTIRRPPFSLLLGELRSFLFYHPPPPDPAALGNGGGHRVLIIPPLLTSDAMLGGMHAFLRRCGFLTAGWGQGINLGPTPAALAGLRDRVRALHAESGQALSVVGISMGGLMARDLAHDLPDHVHQIITVASPIRFPTATTIEPVLRLLQHRFSQDIDIARLSRRPPMPSMTLWSSADGIVDGASCRGPGEPSHDVGGRHVTICRNPETLRLIARRLLDLRR